jgi:hypothetical protein
MANIKETPQYQLYLEVLEAVKRGGYEIERCNNFQSFVKRGSENVGQIFVVKEPLDDSGCLTALIPGVINFINSWSGYESMKAVVRSINNRRNRSKTYWPDYSLVGGFTQDGSGYKYDDRWINIMESVISRSINE